MQYANLGASGLTVSRICLGMMTYGTPAWRPWVLDEAQARPIVRRAVDLGVNFFDTADMYSRGESEVLTGRLLREFFPRREDCVVATKVYFNVHDANAQQPNRQGLSRKHIMQAIDDSLSRLGLDHVDLYQIHRWDPLVPIAETMEALHDVVKAGKARYIGASSMFAWQFFKAQATARERGATPFVSMQNHYNLVYREEEREMIPLCRELGVGLIPWSPLARGFLAGNRSKDGPGSGATQRARTDGLDARYYYRDGDFRVVEALGEVAQARGVSHAQVAYAWLLGRGVTAPIVGCSRLQQVDDACAAVDLALTPAEMAALEAPYEPHPVLGHG